MSILAVYQQVDSAEQLTAALFLLCWLIGAGMLAWWLGVFNGESIRGPIRVGRDMPVFGVFTITFLAFIVWMVVQVAYVGFAAEQFKHAHPQDVFDTDRLTPGDFAFLSTVPFVIGLALLLLGDAALRREIPQRLGYSIDKLLPGVGKAIVAMLIVLPIMWVASTALQIFYDLVHYKHPPEHELLGAMKDAPVHLRILLVIGACALAPVFEEMFFRGHVQSILLRLFTRARVPQTSAPLAVVTTESGDALSMPLSIEAPVLAYQADEPKGPVEPDHRARWLATLMSAVIFAAFHPLWMALLIFVLAICLGYAYERTGNLWTTIFMHAIFNAASTVIFLNVM